MKESESEAQMAARTLILAHGVLGFGSLPEPLGLLNYFNGVAAHLRRAGHGVIAPTVNPVGSVVQRGNELAGAVLSQLAPGEKIHVIAHSMGGLDARHAITHIPEFRARVATLVTIGTPHRGSPVADAIAGSAGELLAHVPTFVVDHLRANSEALRDLRTDVGRHFDDTTPDMPGVRYINVAGDASRGGNELLLFQLAAAIGRLRNEVNDGVVTRTSALRDGHEHLPDWPVDHAGEIGWSFDSALLAEVGLPLLPTPPHLARYDAVVAIL